ncbi:MAG: SgcJ/EcaC family oxidoreductase [Bryobacteraceae bacterium]|nr:SgcJ/EcaC family oxidoreductase [Bryobacteraceae bacterium]
MLHILLLSLTLSQPASATLSQDEAAIRALITRYMDAREALNEEQTEALFTSDADQLVSSGEWRRGKDALVKGVMASSRQNEGRRTVQVQSVRFLTADVAIADGRYEIAAAETRRMWSTFILHKTPSGWRIAAIRNMLPAPRG